jgi:Ni/Fe-hydrogenase 1 B-type cytochrome subunit
MAVGTLEEIRRVRVWPGWLRAAHWLIAAGVLFQLFSAWTIDQGARDPQFWRDWHLIVGQGVALALALRIVLLFVPGTGNWRALAPDKSPQAFLQMVKFYFSLGRVPLPGWYAHNPFWKPIYPMVLLVLAAVCATGMLGVAGLGDPDNVAQWHRRLAHVIAIFTLCHVVAVVLHDLKGEGAFLSSMISGYRYFHVGGRTRDLLDSIPGPSSVSVPLDSLKKPGKQDQT